MRRGLLLLAALLTLALHPVPHQAPRSSPNLHPDPALVTATGWTMDGATHSSVSRGAGGSIALVRGQRANGPPIPITPGQTYTCGLYFQSQHAPTDFLRLSLSLADGQGQWLRNSPGASDYGYPRPDRWQEAVIVHTAQPDEHALQFLLSRARTLSADAPLWVDDLYCGEGVSFAGKPSRKRPFRGGLVRVDRRGHVRIRQADGTWHREFLRCMFALGAEDWTVYAANGWNCNMWASSLAAIQRGVDAGLPYAFFQLAQYIHPGAWAYGNLDRLRADLGAILDSPYRDHLIGYYLDNESPEQFELAQQVIAVVRELDMLHGQRQRPVYILQGQPGRAPAYRRLADMTGTYVQAGGAPGRHLHTLRFLPGQTTPVVFGQIQESSTLTGQRLADEVRATLEAGGTALGYWHRQPITLQPWYLHFPGIVERAQRVLDGGTWDGE